MKNFLVQKSNLHVDGEFYPENSTAEFDEKKKHVKQLIENGFLVEAKPAKEEKPSKDKKPVTDESNK